MIHPDRVDETAETPAAPGWAMELRIAIQEGLLSRGEAEALAVEARQRRIRPLALLVKRGQLSDDSYASFAVRIAEATRELPAPTAHVAEPSFPVAGWDRYRGVRFLGQGGMGKVFLAVDPKLHREVAIKFLHGDHPEFVRRLIAEARAQARVNHDRVCKVHEVGEIDGKVYIAMQYIMGVPLAAVARTLTIEQKVMLVLGAAEGIHAAHCVGIIHRDVKPSNIMVERTESGELRPYVMDFGLARAAHQPGTTLTGSVVGTPGFMAPEQAHSDPGNLDRRADVYGLGATLYYLTTGLPPVVGDGLVEVIHNSLTREVIPPRVHDHDIPADLEAIVMKCLERERSARYDSARALADDLARFMASEPVTARPADTWYRLRKRIAKHRRPVAAGGVLVALLLATAGWGLANRRAAEHREQLARRFTEQVERIEAMARYSALSPVHDIRPDRAAIRDRMTALADEVGRGGEAVAGPGQYALGRGYLALDDSAAARGHLEAAWQRGFREPQVAYALALALGQLYKAQLAAAGSIEQKALREVRMREIELAYRDPALHYLAASAGAEVPSIAYVRALIAFYEGKLDAALRELDSIGDALPWFYEAGALRGDILRMRSQRAGDPVSAARDIAAARSAYIAAAAIGESVPAVRASLGDLEYRTLVSEIYGHGEVAPAFERTLAAVDRALAVAPDHYDSLLLAASARRGLAEYRANRGDNVDDLLTQAVGWAERAIAVAPDRPGARIELAEIYSKWGDLRAGHDQDPAEQLRKAVEISEGIAESDRDAYYHSHLGSVFTACADYRDKTGGDVRDSRDRAIDEFTRALGLDPQLLNVRINLGINLYKRGRRPPATPSSENDLAQAIRFFEEVREQNPSHVVPYFYEGEIYELRGERADAIGSDPGPDFERAIDRYRGGIAVNPTVPHLHNGTGVVWLERAKHAWARGDDPAPQLVSARAAFDQAVAVAPAQGFGYGHLGMLELRRAWFARAAGGDPSSAIAAAIAALRLALDKIPNHARFWANLAIAHARRATIMLDHGGDPEPAIAEAEGAIHHALAINPKEANAWQALGEVGMRRAAAKTRRGQPAAAELIAAAHAFESALEIDQENPDVEVELGELWCMRAELARAEPRDPSLVNDEANALDRAHALVDHVLARYPGRPDARHLLKRLLVGGGRISALRITHRVP